MRGGEEKAGGVGGKEKGIGQKLGSEGRVECQRTGSGVRLETN